MTSADIGKLLAREEGQYFERKSLLEGPSDAKKPRDRRSVRDDIAVTIAAFANADGGTLVLEGSRTVSSARRSISIVAPPSAAFGIGVTAASSPSRASVVEPGGCPETRSRYGRTRSKKNQKQARGTKEPPMNSVIRSGSRARKAHAKRPKPMPKTQERHFEDAIENHLVTVAGWGQGHPRDFDRKTALVAKDFFAFVEKTNPRPASSWW